MKSASCAEPSTAFRSLLGTNNGIAGQVLVNAGTEAQKEKYLPGLASGALVASFALTESEAGSDPSGLRTKAVLDGDNYVLNGQKRFITNANKADLFTVMARSDPEKPGAGGVSAFLVERNLPGLSVGKMPELDRPADPARGQAIYASNCVACHNTDGSGIRRSLPTTDLGYTVPPLWGSDSFNDGAGMARLITAANFIHFNMPHGADYLNPQLTPEQAWDVAAYVISQPRPHKAGLDKDFPDLLEKPVDAPYGPYADGFSAQQHTYGPFAPIRAAVARLKAEKAPGSDGGQR